MRTTTLLTGLLGLSLATASPTETPKRGKSLRLPLKRSGFSNKNTDVANVKSIYDNTDWTVEVAFGGQTFNVQVDTGSSDIWILSKGMPESLQKQFPENHFYDPSASKTFKKIDGASFNITYGTGGIHGAGDIGTDEIAIGDDKVVMPFGLATDVTPGVGMVDKIYDGMLGLAFGAYSTFKPNKGYTWMQAMIGTLDKPVFTFNVPVTDRDGFIEFGAVDKSLYNGTLTVAKVDNGTADNPKGWITNVAFSLNGKNISSTMNEMLMDTGGLFTQVPDGDAVSAYWKNVNGAVDSKGDGTSWSFPCNGPALPDLTFDFMSVDGRVVSGHVYGKFLNSTQSNNGMCKGAFQKTTGQGIIGYAFFHSFFTVFDQATPSLSFAPYPNQELLDGKAIAASSNNQASAAGSSSAGSASASAPASGVTTVVTLTGGSGVSTGVTTVTALTGGSNPSASGSASASAARTAAADRTSSGGVVAATAAPSGQSDSAPGGSGVSKTSSASNISAPSLAVITFAAAGVLMWLNL